MASIGFKTAECFRCMSELIEWLTINPSPVLSTSELEDQQGRLRIWSSNMGALAKGPASLDHRLREAPTVFQNVSKLLEELQNHLIETLAVQRGNRIPFEKNISATASLDDISSLASASSDSSSSESTKPTTEVEQRYLDTINIIDHLFKLSVKIRGPTQGTRSSRAATYQEVDTESGIDIFESFKRIDREYVREAIYYARNEINTGELHKEELVDRLASAITTRRRLLSYWQKHREKLSMPSSEHYFDLNKAVNQMQSLSISEKLQPARTPSQILRETRKPATILSATAATTFLEAQLEDIEETRSNISTATTAVDLQGLKTAVPPAPVDGSNKDFECSLCSAMCPSSFRKHRIWRSHVFHDLAPYMCTYSGCSEGNKTYASRRAWLEHEGRAHRCIWRCEMHPKEAFLSKESFKKHLEASHNPNLSTTEINQLSQASETTTDDQRTECPICATSITLSRDLHNHLAQHLERFAVFAIPRRLFSADNEEADSDASQHARPRSTSVELIAPATFDGWIPKDIIRSIFDFEPTEELSPHRMTCLAWVKDGTRRCSFFDTFQKEKSRREERIKLINNLLAFDLPEDPSKFKFEIMRFIELAVCHKWHLDRMEDIALAWFEEQERNKIQKAVPSFQVDPWGKELISDVQNLKSPTERMEMRPYMSSRDEEQREMLIDFQFQEDDALEGQIYIAESSDVPGYIMIGWTSLSPENCLERKRVDCRIDFTIVYRSEVIPFAKRLENIVYSELADKRYRFAGLCPFCIETPKRHDEWFLTTAERAQHRIEYWKERLFKDIGSNVEESLMEISWDKVFHNTRRDQETRAKIPSALTDHTEVEGTKSVDFEMSRPDDLSSHTEWNLDETSYSNLQRTAESGNEKNLG